MVYIFIHQENTVSILVGVAMLEGSIITGSTSINSKFAYAQHFGTLWFLLLPNVLVVCMYTWNFMDLCGGQYIIFKGYV